MKQSHSVGRRWLKTMLTLLLVSAPFQWVSAQITLNSGQTQLRTVIQKIKQQTKYEFFLDDKLAKSQVPAIKVHNASIQDVLSHLLAGKDVTYRIEGNVVYLKRRAEGRQAAPAPQQTKSKGTPRKVSGTIVDEHGEPLIGATVSVKGTNDKAVTDLDGKYTISTDVANPVLVVSYVGYQDKEMRVSGPNADLALQPDAKSLNEVVVTALGIKRAQKALSYNVQQVAGDELSVNKDANFINSLSGKVAGVNINASSSGAGGASKVVLRGARSIEQSSNVLYVIDGVPMLNQGGDGSTEFGSSGVTEAIADINPEDIESMSVLTGAAAAALYGNKASNGAIVITTKKGKVGKTELTVSQTTEISSAFRMPEFQNRYGTGSSLNEQGAASYSWGKRLNEANYYGYDPEDDFLRHGVMTNESFTLSTGSDKNQTFLSASMLNSGGIIPNNKYNRYNFTIRNTTNFLNDKMTLDLGASYIIQNDRNMTNQGVYANPLVTAYLFPRGNDFNEVKMFEYYDTADKIYKQNWNGLISEMVGQNPYWVSYRNRRDNKKYRYMMSAGLTYKVLPWMSLAGRVRIDNANNKFEKKYYATTNQTLAGTNGFYGLVKTEDKQTYADFLVNIDKRWLQDRLSLSANLGASISDVKQEIFGNEGNLRDDLIPNVFNIYQIDPNKEAKTQSGYHDQTKSLFASVELGWDSQYYLTLTARNDWPSMLAGPQSTKSSFFYPSVGLSWIVSETFKLPEMFDYLKVRGSFASVGLPFPRWYANPRYEWDNNTKAWKTQSVYPMYNLKPERTDSWEVGLQSKLWKHFNVDFTYYYTKTVNQTFNPDISVSSGYSTMYIQTGQVSNWGIELAVGYNNHWGDFGWSSNYTFSLNRNKIDELVKNYVHPETGAIINKDRLDVGGLGHAHFILKEGGTLGDLYSNVDVMRDSEGKVYVDSEGKVYTNQNVGDIKLGSIFPKSNMAWRNDFTWKGFNLGFMFSARFGGICYSATQANLDKYGVSEATAQARDLGYVLVNGNNYVNPEVWYTTIGANDGIPQYYTYSATNIRLQEASIGYTFKKNVFFGIGDLTLSVIGRNLFMLYCKAPFDPEMTASTGNYYQGIDKFMTPSTRTIGFNAKLKF